MIHIIFSIFFNLMVLLIILLLIGEALKKYKLYNEKFILILIPLLAFNILITSKYIEVKSDHNISTYASYNLVKNAFNQIKYPNKMENKNDMKELISVIEDINEKLNIFEINLRSSSITYDSEEFYLLIKSLNNSLNQFISKHNKHFGKNKQINSFKLEKYQEMKVQLVMIEHHLSKLGSSSSRKFGVQQYRLSLSGKDQYDWISKLEERISNIEKIVKEL